MDEKPKLIRFNLRRLLFCVSCVAVPIALWEYEPHDYGEILWVKLTLTAILFGAGTGSLMNCTIRGAIIGLVTFAGMLALLNN